MDLDAFTYTKRKFAYDSVLIVQERKNKIGFQMENGL